MAKKPPRGGQAPRKAGQRPAARGRLAKGTVLPLALGQDGVSLQVGHRQLSLPAGVPGDQLRVSLPRSERGTAQPVQLLQPGPSRVPCACPLLDSCGGCTLQAMDYSAQLEAKGEALSQTLARLGHGERVVVDGVSQPYGYRTKLLMASGGRPGELRFGFYRRGSMALVPAEGCPVQHPLTLATLAAARQVLDGARLAPSRRGDDPGGWLHALGVRVDPQSGQCELALSGATARPPGLQRLVEQLQLVSGVSGVHLSVNRQRTSYPLEGELRCVAGARRTAFTLAGERVLLSAGSFVQTNAEAAQLLVQRVQQLLPRRMGLLVDLYAGAGVFSLATRGRWRRALCVESSPSAVADLRHHLQRAQLPGLTAVHGKVEQQIAGVLAREPDAVLLDPPRRGCHPQVIRALLRQRPPLVLLVACGYEALVTQAEQLVRGGYRIGGAAAVDMFPHTAHLEVVLRLEAA